MASVTMHQQGAELVCEVYTQTRHWADDSEYSVLRMTMEQNGARQDEVTLFFDNLAIGDLERMHRELGNYIFARKSKHMKNTNLNKWIEEVGREAKEAWTSK